MIMRPITMINKDQIKNKGIKYLYRINFIIYQDR